MPVTASSLIHTFTIITRDFIHNTTQRFHLNREMFTITSQECKSAPVSLTAISLSGQICNRIRDGIKIPSTSYNLVRSKLSAQLMFSQDDEVERRKGGEFLNGIIFFGSHTTNVESETVKRLSRGGGRWRFCFLFLLLSTLLDTGIGRLPSADAGSDDCRQSPDCVWGR